RASTISPRPTSTSGAVKLSCWKDKGSNARPSKTVGCFTTNKPRNINHDAPDSLLVHAASCLKISDDGQALLRLIVKLKFKLAHVHSYLFWKVIVASGRVILSHAKRIKLPLFTLCEGALMRAIPRQPFG